MRPTSIALTGHKVNDFVLHVSKVAAQLRGESHFNLDGSMAKWLVTWVLAAAWLSG